MSVGRRIDVANALALAIALTSAAAIAYACSPRTAVGGAAIAVVAPTIVEALPDGGVGVRGSDQVAVRVADYRRIASLVPEADEALAVMGMVDRLSAIGAYSRGHSVYARHLAAVPGTIASGSGVEDVLTLKPDLVLVSAFSDPGRTERLRAAGIPVFHLGSASGAAEAALAVRRIAALCGESALGDRQAERFLQRLARVADPALSKTAACYVECVGTQLFLASAGTNQSDILVAAGFEDAAARVGYRGYGECRIEDLLRIAPAVIIAPVGSGATLAGLVGSAGIPAIAQHRIIEVDAGLLSSPGVAMLDAAEAVAAGRGRLP